MGLRHELEFLRQFPPRRHAARIVRAFGEVLGHDFYPYRGKYLHGLRRALSRPIVAFGEWLEPKSGVIDGEWPKWRVKSPPSQRGVKVVEVHEYRHVISADGRNIPQTFCNRCGCEYVTPENTCASCGLAGGRPISAPS